MKNLDRGFAGLFPSHGKSDRRWARPTPAELMNKAGRSRLAGEPGFEQLEQRQLMFALGVTLPANLAPGQFFSGTVQTSTAAGYVLPFANAIVPDPTMATAVLENFDENTSPAPVPVPSGAQFGATSRLTINHNLASLPRLVERTDGNKELYFGLRRGDQVKLGQTRSSGVGLTSLRSMVITTTAVAAIPNIATLDANDQLNGQTDINVLPLGTRLRLFLNGVPVLDAAGNEIAYSAPLSGFPTDININSIRTVDSTVVPFTVSYLLMAPNNGVFDEVVFERIANPPGGVPGIINPSVDDILITQVALSTPPGVFAALLGRQIFGVASVLTADVSGFRDIATGADFSVNESFDASAPGPVTSGRIFTAVALGGTPSRLGVFHNLAGAPSVSGGVDRTLNFTLAGTQQILFAFMDDGVTPTPRALIQFAFSTPSGAGTSLDAGTRISLFRQGRLVQTFTDAALAELRTTAGGVDTYLLRPSTIDDRGQVITPSLGIDNEASEAFDAVVFSRTGGVGNDVISVNDVRGFHPPLVEFFDLYGRPLRDTLALGLAGGEERVLPVDPEDDGIPNFNDGIGRIVLSNTTVNSALNIYGGTIAFEEGLGYVFSLSSTLAGSFSAFEGLGFGYVRRITGGAVTVLGLPGAQGSVSIGSSFVRDPGSTASYLGELPQAPTVQPLTTSVIAPAQILPLVNTEAATLLGFNNNNFTTMPLFTNAILGLPVIVPDPNPAGIYPASGLPTSVVIPQGVFTTNGQSVGSVLIDGLLHGSSSFTGAIGRLNVGYLLGSVSVAGDAGTIIVAGDSGGFFLDPVGTVQPIDGTSIRGIGRFIATGSTITVGRALGQIHVGGRNYSSISVLGDNSNPNRARLDFSRYFENEVIYGLIPPPGLEPELFYNLLTILSPSDFGFINSINAGMTTRQNANFGGGLFRNDNILGAEFIGNPTGRVAVAGRVGGFGPVTSAGEEDLSDVYAFAAEAGRLVTIAFDLTTTFNVFAQVRVIDSRGRTIATHQTPAVSSDRTPSGNVSAQIRFEAPSTDVFYISITVPPTGAALGFTPYLLDVTGLMPTNLGLVSVAAHSPTTTTVNGALGLYRVGVGRTALDGGNVGPNPQTTASTEITNDLLTQRGMSLSVSGNAGAILFGSSLDTVLANLDNNTINIGGFLGALRTGVSPAAGIGPTIGDLGGLDLRVGSSIGLIDVNSAIGGRSTTFLTQVVAPTAPVRITTGTAGGPGHIGAILVGTFIVGSNFTLTTSAGSIIDRFVLGTAGLAGGPDSGRFILRAPDLNLGAGSDIRFADFSAVASGFNGAPTIESFFSTLNFNTPFITTDDSGVIYSVAISGGTNSRASSGRLVAIPVSGGTGFVTGRIEANLVGGAELRVSTGAGSLGLGRVVITTDGGLRRSSVNFTGAGEIDVLLFEQTSGGPLEVLRNSTPGGDIVAADVRGVRTVSLAGNLGRTQVTSASQRLIGPFLGIAQELNQTTGGPIGLPAFVMNPWDGTVYDDVTAREFLGTGLDGIGSPFDPFLNGIIVRAGSVTSVVANGSIGDVILQDPAGRLESVIPNADGRTAFGDFDGIVGSIFANDITTVDIGDGLIGPGPSSFAQAGIFAINDIQRVLGGSRIRNPVLAGVIIAGNSGAVPVRGRADGIGQVILASGRFDGAFIGGATLDSWFRGPRNTASSSFAQFDSPTALAPVALVQASNAGFFRTTVFGSSIGTVRVDNGAFDASTVQAQGFRNVVFSINDGTIDNVIATEFKNTTRDGEATEIRGNQILASGNITNIIASLDIRDLTIGTNSEIRGVVQGRNIIRTDIRADRAVRAIVATNDFRASTVTTGRLDVIVAADIRSSTLTVSGIIGTVAARGAITSSNILSTGNDGRINVISATGDITGTISAGGLINQIVSSNGNIDASIRTTDATDGAINLLFARGDIRANIKVDRNIVSIIAGGNIGRDPATGPRDLLDVNGSVTNIIAGRQLYADVRVAQSILGIVQAGATTRANAVPASDQISTASIVAFGRIANVRFFGDFAGNILSYSGGIGAVTIVNGSLRRPTGAFTNAIEARDGDISAVTVVRGNVFGSIAAPDGSIGSVVITGDAVFGNLGIDPTLSSATTTGIPVSESRNQLPPGVASTGGRDGPTISAGLDIGRVIVGRSMFESTISAGRNLSGVTVAGNIDGTALPANGQQSAIVAGDLLSAVTVVGSRLAGTSSARGTLIASGIVSLGADNAPGGTGINADTVKSGVVQSVAILSGADTIRVFAGINPGPDGIYGNGDDTVAPGLSSVNGVTVATGNGVTQNSLVFADTSVTGVTNLAGVTTGGSALPVQGNLAFTGSTAGFLAIPNTGVGQAITIGAANAFARFTGPGTAFYDAVNSRIVLLNTTASSRLTVDPQSPATSFANFRVITNDDASLGQLTINAGLTGTSGVYVDGTLNGANFGTVNLAPTAADLTNGTRTIRAGQSIGALTLGAARSTATNAVLIRSGAAITSIISNGSFGAGSSSRIDALALGTLTVIGDLAGVVSVDRDLGAVRATGAFTGRLRAGYNINSVVADSATNARVSARGNLNSVSITRDADGSAFLAGTDLGTDANFGTTAGLAGSDDTVTNGLIASVFVGGNFTRSDVAAGVNRGPDGFFATSDDLVADGRSNIQSVRVIGSAVGSNNNSQTYGVTSNGTVVSATVAGATLDRIANFNRRLRTEATPPLQVTDLRIINTAPRNYAARITFNQNIDVGANLVNILAAITIAEVRDNGATLLPLTGGLTPGAGVDYAASYDAATRTLTLQFAEAITTRNLLAANVAALSFLASPDPRTGGAGQGAGPGVYRFTIAGGTASNALRGATISNTLDGNANGLRSATDNFIQQALVGDAGDRFVNAVTLVTTTRVDLFAPTSLNALLDNPQAPDGLPQVNSPFTINGIIGDHPDTDVNQFRFQNDIDLFSISLRAGQVLRLSEISGAARQADRVIFAANGTPLAASRFTSPGSVSGDPTRDILSQLTFNSARIQLLANPDPRSNESLYLVRQTGDYVIAVGQGFDVAGALQNPFGSRLAGLGPVLTTASAVPGVSLATNFDLNANQTGDYRFTIEVVEDGDNGFNGQLAPTDSSVGGAGVPQRTGFFGDDATFGTFDDLIRITRPDAAAPNADGVANPDFVFQLFAGADGILGNADDVVRGTNGRGIIAERIGGAAPIIRRTNVAGATTQSGTIPTFAAFPTAATTVNSASSILSGPGSAAFVFSRLPGPDGTFGNSDDVIFGSNGSGINATRTGGRDGILDNADDEIRFSPDSGDGASVVRAPLPSEFRGTDNTLGTPDDLVTIPRGEWTFRLLPGDNRILNGNANSDDQVVGTNAAGTRLIRTAGADRSFSNAANTDDATTFTAAIGRPGVSGAASTGTLDTDVYHLNNGNAIAPGTRYRVTLKLSESGGNISLLPGIRNQLGNLIGTQVVDTRGLVQLALFETTRNPTATTGPMGTNLVNSQLVAAPNNVGRSNTTQAEVRNNTIGAAYGYDANGDFFMEFATPRSQDGTNANPTFALYLQGVVQSDYQLEIVQLPSITLPTARTQNVLIDIDGSSSGIRFLEANPFSGTPLLPFSTTVNSFSGTINGVSIDSYVLNSSANPNNLINRLQAIFDAALGANVVRFSTNAADFEGQTFSTVFLTASDEPPAFVTSNINLAFGNSQGVDIFNANPNDQAVVFLKSLNLNNNLPDQAGVDDFTAQLSIAVTRRVGELLGVRLNSSFFIAAGLLNAPLPPGTPVDVFANDSPLFIFGSNNVFSILGNYAGVPTATRLLSPVDVFARDRFILFGNDGSRNLIGADLFSTGTQFAYGSQAAGSLLNRTFFI